MKDIKLSPKSAGSCLLILFIISGFAGLIYQSIWSHYLGLVLGHAAYAQSLVLSIFMGGMALGAWLISQRTPHWSRLILGYAVIEGIIGFIGLFFQDIFVWYTDFSQNIALPAITSTAVAHLYQWGTAALLIFPQCLLLGATFPLLSAGYLRITPQEDGQVLGGLYFTNSLGAACGALAATFLLLPAVGLPGSMLTAGVLNIIVALGAWLVSQSIEKNQNKIHVIQHKSENGSSSPEKQAVLSKLTVLMLAATAISGAASFVYETGWIRLLNQVFGSTVHSFEIMLAAFIFGLAFGGLWIRKKSATITNSLLYVSYIQIFMGIAALISIPLFAQSFHWVGWIMSTLVRNENGYLLFEIATASISLLIMFPAAFFAGMTLPLFTMSLLRSGADEQAIGRIYAANTLGSIAGVILMVHLLIPSLGIKNSIALAALIDTGLGIYLLYFANTKIQELKDNRPQFLKIVTPGIIVLLVFVGCMKWGHVDPVTQMSGVFRNGTINETSENNQALFLHDGKTATIGVIQKGSGNNKLWIISTNGKPDAGLTASMLNTPSADEITMIMLGAMPLMAHPEPRDIALIGWGSGLSTHTVLGSSLPQRVDTIEIEPIMYEGAKLFMNRVERAYNDPRSHIHFEDARTFMAMGARSYDIIVSEPSNPWVSGVASLFTKEFYAFLKSHLNENGILVQWLHSYELNDALLATMLLALVEEFPEVDIYLSNSLDIIIIAYKDEHHFLNSTPWQETSLKEEMQRVGLNSLADIQLRYIGSAELIRQLARINQVTAHSDFFPTVSLEAPLSRFKNDLSLFFSTLRVNGFPVLDILECNKPVSLQIETAETGIALLIYDRYQNAKAILQAMQRGTTDTILRSHFEENRRAELVYALALLREPLGTKNSLREWGAALDFIARNTIGLVPSEDLENLWTGMQRRNWLPDSILEDKNANLLFSAYRSAAMRNSKEMYENTNAILNRFFIEGNFDISIENLENLLIIGMLGAIGQDEPLKAIELFEQYGSHIPIQKQDIILLLYYWADGMASGDINSCRQ